MRRALLGLLALGCDGDRPFVYDLPPDLPAPVLPEGRTMTVAQVALGERLFFDPRLSGDGTIACASCHEPRHAFADPRPRSVGAHGDLTLRNSPGLQNVAYYASLSWASPSITTIEDFLLLPMFGEDPIEMGITGNERAVVDRLDADPALRSSFRRAYGEPVSVERARDALGAFVRSLVAFNSPFDRFSRWGEPDAMDAAALRGMDLFFSEKFECHHCHGGMQLSRSLSHERLAFSSFAFDNVGLYADYPDEDEGLYASTGREADRGRFRPPSLRNVALTAPYMHDGSLATLDDVLNHYASGGQPHPGRSGFVIGFSASEQERSDLLAFLRALTDMSYVSDSRFPNRKERWP